MKTTTNIQPKLSIVGAGPGDVDLITVKGMQALASADIVLYDALVNVELFKYVPLHVKRIFVGKRKGNHAYTQEQINSLIVDSAFTYGHVVRLKGGDPFVFGRGYEEYAHAHLFNIETEIIPGVSSSIAVPELQGIPITLRGVSESFWVITGTTSAGKLSGDIKLAAQSNASVIILMGLSKLQEICEVYKSFQKNDLPIAIIQNGSLEEERIALGTIDSIIATVEEEGISSPSVIMIGEVVKQHPLFSAALLNKERALEINKH